MDELIELQRAANRAREEATEHGYGYSSEAWRPWLDAAEALTAAITAHAAARAEPARRRG
ncbi:hypothetical protein [Streptomyces sp. NPDC001820]|uniref:hypothetical protein n=1 Tax=Streptomyces sp. NPDC001820 TaxID=3364613 RepID=UPI0036A750A8